MIVETTRARGLSFAFALLVLAFGGVCAAQELDGSWSMTILGKSPIGESEAEVTFQRDGFSLAVTVEAGGKTVDCAGFIDGDAIRFDYPGKKGPVKFRGHVSGDLMGGVAAGDKGDIAWQAWRGTEHAADLAGSWTMVMKGESPSGENMATLTFHQQGNNLIVTMSGARGDVQCDGYIDGSGIRFYYIRDTGSGRFTAKFSGHVGGDLMGGEVEMGERGATTWRATRNIE